MKKACFPHGTDEIGNFSSSQQKDTVLKHFLGVYALFLSEIPRGPSAQYIHKVEQGGGRGTLIITCNQYLLALIHQATSFEVDTTFRRLLTTKLDEWELVIYHKPSGHRELLYN